MNTEGHELLRTTVSLYDVKSQAEEDSFCNRFRASTQKDKEIVQHGSPQLLTTELRVKGEYMLVYLLFPTLYLYVLSDPHKQLRVEEKQWKKSAESSQQLCMLQGGMDTSTHSAASFFMHKRVWGKINGVQTL